MQFMKRKDNAKVRFITQSTTQTAISRLLCYFPLWLIYRLVHDMPSRNSQPRSQRSLLHYLALCNTVAPRYKDNNEAPVITKNI